MNQFPVERHIRVYGPAEDLSAEIALLLNPYEDHPERHIKFVLPRDFDDDNLILGTIEPLDEKGRTSVKVFKLDRQALNESRRRAQINIRSRLYMAMANGKNVSLISSDLREGREEYSAACYAYANGWMKSRQALWEGASGN